MSASSYAYGKGFRLLEILSIATFAVLSIWALARLAVESAAFFPLVLLCAVPAGWLLSDLLSGIAHWTFDTVGSPMTPIIGAALIRPFREHHADPEGMTRHDFIETHGASCLAALPLLAFAVLVPLSSPISIAVQALGLFTSLGALATNQCHKWAHTDESETPAVVRWAQRHRLVLPREHHRLHHTAPFDSHFCMSNGWLNRPFNALLRAWR